MKFDKNLIKNMKASIVTARTVKEAVEDIDIESAMEEFDTNGFKKKLTVDDLPQSIQNLMRFPYIPNQNVIDSIKYNEELKQILIQFKLQFKKLSDAFISKANTDRLIGSLTTRNTDRIVSFGLNNMRMIIVFQLVKSLENGKPETENSAKEEMPTEEKITEGVDDWHSTEKPDAKDADNYVLFAKQNIDNSNLKKLISDKIVNDDLNNLDYRNIMYQTVNQVPKINLIPLEMVVDAIIKKAKSINESTSSTVALEQILTDMAVSIHQIVGDSQTDEERKELKKIWSDKIKEIEKNLK